MKNVTVKKKDLKKILAKNRSEHREIFLEAQKKYREQAIKMLDEQLALARDNKPFAMRRLVAMIEPQDHTAEYDRVLGMLDMEIADKVTPDQADFQKFVQDDWDWSRGWAISNSSYVHSPKFAPYTGE